MKRVYLGNTELTTIATITNGGGGGDDTQKWLDYFNGTLTEFTVPEGVTKINTATFNTCTGLTSLTLPSSITSIDNIRRMEMYGETNPFGTLKTMTVKATTPPQLPDYEIPIPTTISRIDVPKYSVIIYKAIDGWNSYADKIQALPQNETVVTYNDGTTKKLDIKGDLTQTSIENKKDITKVIIGDDVTKIGYEAFVDCSGLTSVVIPDGVTKIGGYAFQGCSNLKSLTIGTGITELGHRMLNACLSISSITILSPNKPTADSWTFFGCQTSGKLYVPSNLLADYQSDSNYTNAFKGGIYAVENSMKVTYADNTEKTFTDLTAINEDTDSNKKNAKTVEIYDTVLSINRNAFQNCSGMTSVVIPDSVIYIGYWSFLNCSGLTSVTIPSSVTKFGFGPFQECKNLASVTIKNSANKLTYSNQAFYGISSNAKLYVPSNLLSDYQADSAWTGAFKGGIYAIQ